MEENKILTLNEAAEILGLSPETVLNLVSQKEIKSVKIGNQWRFEKDEVKRFKASPKKINVEKIATENVISRFFSFINSDHIIMNLTAGHRFDILAKMSQFAKKNKACTKNRWLFDMLCSREKMLSTAVGNGIAFLHPRKIHPEKIKYSSVFLGISRKRIEFRSMDKTPVNLFFLILMKSEKQHLFALSYLSQLLRDEALKDRIIKAKSKKQILELLKIKF